MKFHLDMERGKREPAPDALYRVAARRVIGRLLDENKRLRADSTARPSLIVALIRAITARGRAAERRAVLARRAAFKR